MSLKSYLLPTIAVFLSTGALIISGCGPSSSVPPAKKVTQEEKAYLRTATASRGNDIPALPPARPAMEPSELLREARVYKDLIPRGQHARKYQRKMNPRYITIHSTQNYSEGADAWRHSTALKNGKLRAYKRKGGNRIGYLVWHYSIDDQVVVQHLPTNEQGEHADFDGPGNNYSIGIEMCEDRGNNRSETIERTAKLTAYLMHKHNIPLSNIVPHYHWPRRGLSKPNKNCPHFLLDNGKPGKKWKWFQSVVQGYYDKITVPVPYAGPAERVKVSAVVEQQQTDSSATGGYLYGL